MREYRLWTTREVQQIRILARHHDAPTIAKMLNRSQRSVDSAALRHGISFTALRAWTEEEDNILREQANKMLLRRLAKKLKRTPDMVRSRAKQLGLSLRKSGYYHHHATHPMKVRKQYAKLRASGMAQATAARAVGVHQATARRWEPKKETEQKMKVTGKTYNFEGGEFTAPQIHKMMPIYSEKAIRSYLAEGAASKADIHSIAHQRKLNSAAQAKKNAIAGGLNNSMFFTEKGK